MTVDTKLIFSISIMQHGIKSSITHSLMKMLQSRCASFFVYQVVCAEHGKRPNSDTRDTETDRKNNTATETDALFHATQWVRKNKSPESSFRMSGTVTSANASTKSERFFQCNEIKCIFTVLKVPQWLKRIWDPLNLETLTLPYLMLDGNGNHFGRHKRK